MAATFASTILEQPAIASLVFEFQFGVYEDVRPAFRACNELIEFEASRRNYECDASFGQAFAPTTKWYSDLTDPVPSSAFALNKWPRNDRLPLHVAIYLDAIILAFLQSHLEIVEFLLDERENTPELFERVNFENYSGCFVGHSIRRFPGPFLDTLLARKDSKGVTLLQRFGPSPDDFPGPQDLYIDYTPEKVRQVAIEAATLENATLALDLFPWLHYPSLLDDMAGRGFLPLVRSLHERGFKCSTNAMDKAAANGHLEAIEHGHLNVVRFLIEHRTEGASDRSLDHAAGRGHLEVLQYLHSLGSFRWSGSAVEMACARGHLNLVKFLMTNETEDGASYYMFRNAFKYGHLATVKYLLSRGHECVTAKMHWDLSAFRKPKIIKVLQLFLDVDGPRDAKWMKEACATNNVPLTRFLHELAGDRCHRSALGDAIAHEAWDVVHYLMAHSTANVPIEALKQLLSCGQFDIATQILGRQRKFRKDDSPLEWSSTYHYTEATRYLLGAGIGKPRECLVKIAGRRQHVTASKLLLPHCMDAAKYLDNVTFLLDLVALPDRHHKATLHLITSELLNQGRKASQKIQLSPSLTARASTLLEAGEFVDWSLALVIGHN
ncbi:hypothetical protein SPRG_06420 [Saprolegnia parasitica CBS 223.65]|uniref:Uncharacterized protein n=1 Tax=Saprolegnia parasitica (strain CBS 223.65) TaxID=695850 RepID=A0A067CP19_SAPPC|nr:hypothetical protein SPRG_06420 [Saprolegnia parasitica CBS 223.65]KDO28562.1 hypothetical protein SPRG_06420 [Saprolegnia parasitica CBS 223.65]|eukprot:XP_012200627.1 hypothetical protein SPRG_06420 [Saprolegnia parasitica CBS 223.65]